MIAQLYGIMVSMISLRFSLYYTHCVLTSLLITITLYSIRLTNANTNALSSMHRLFNNINGLITLAVILMCLYVCIIICNVYAVCRDDVVVLCNAAYCISSSSCNTTWEIIR